MFSRGVRIFRQASCYFRSSSEWETDPETFRPVADQLSQSSRFITVPLGDRTASAIKCRFHFSDAWLLFSEVAFQSGERYYDRGHLYFLGLHSFTSYLCLFSRIGGVQHVPNSSLTWTPYKRTARSEVPPSLCLFSTRMENWRA